MVESANCFAVLTSNTLLHQLTFTNRCFLLDINTLKKTTGMNQFKNAALIFFQAVKDSIFTVELTPHGKTFVKNT